MTPPSPLLTTCLHCGAPSPRPFCSPLCHESFRASSPSLLETTYTDSLASAKAEYDAWQKQQREKKTARVAKARAAGVPVKAAAAPSTSAPSASVSESFNEGEAPGEQVGTIHHLSDGSVVTRNMNGELHSFQDHPASVSPDGHRSWYANGVKHRDGDKPATINKFGTQFYYQHGLPHRDNDKPAVISDSGHQEFWKNGHRYTPKG